MVQFDFCSIPTQPQDDNNNQESHSPPTSRSLDIEDIARKGSSSSAGIPVTTKRKRGQMTLGSSLANSNNQSSSQQSDAQLSQSWKEVLGEPPQWGPDKVQLLVIIVQDDPV